MERLIDILGPLLPVLYAAAFAVYAAAFFRDHQTAKRSATPLLVGTVAVHMTYTFLRAVTYGHHPMASVFEILSAVALALALVYLAIETWRKNKSTGLFVLPFVFFIQLTASIGIAPTHEIKPILKDALFGLHTGTIALAYAAFFLSAIYGVMYCVFHRTLKKKYFGLIFEKLPSLSALAQMTFGATVAGFAFLTVAVLCGVVWAVYKIPDYWLDAKIALTSLVWLVYGLVLIGRYVFKWGGRLLVSAVLVGFALLILSTLAVNLFLPGWHRFGV
jgi:ABC-type uncharacterized transport system permease subunit